MTERDYMPQLDSLRAFAVLGVLVAHNWLPVQPLAIFRTFDWGDIGVRLFFVLSGFLITRILIGCRDLANTTSQPTRHFVGRFYIRRFLRIFPVYYVVLAAVLIVNIPPARDKWVWLFSYTSNIYVTLSGEWIGRLSHFWTLAVEEQFYLFWPWLVLFAPRKWLSPIVSILIFLAPAYRFWVATYFPNDLASGAFTKGAFTLSCLDGLGMGALLALSLWSKNQRQFVYSVLNRIVLPVGIVSFVILHLLASYQVYSRLSYTFQDLSLALVFCWLVAATNSGFKGSIGSFLELKPLVYVGKISYGIYIYHNLVPILIAFLARRIGLEYQVIGFSYFVVSSLFVIAIACASWELFERPINNLKRYVKYSPL